MTQAAAAFAAWLEYEIDASRALAPEARVLRLTQLAIANKRWNEIEEAFDATQAAYRAGRGDGSELRRASDRAFAFLSSLGVQVPASPHQPAP